MEEFLVIFWVFLIIGWIIYTKHKSIVQTKEQEESNNKCIDITVPERFNKCRQNTLEEDELEKLNKEKNVIVRKCEKINYILPKIDINSIQIVNEDNCFKQKKMKFQDRLDNLNEKYLAIDQEINEIKEKILKEIMAELCKFTKLGHERIKLEYSYMDEKLMVTVDVHELTLENLKYCYPRLIKFCSQFKTKLEIIHGFHRGTVLKDYVRGYLSKSITSIKVSVFNEGRTQVVIYDEKLINSNKLIKPVEEINSLEVKKEVVESEIKECRQQINRLIQQEEIAKKQIEEQIKEQLTKNLIKFVTQYKDIPLVKLYKIIDNNSQFLISKKSNIYSNGEFNLESFDQLLLIKSLYQTLNEEQLEYLKKIKNKVIAFYQVPTRIKTITFCLLCLYHNKLIYDCWDKEMKSQFEIIISTAIYH